MEKLPQKKIASEINVILLILIRKWKKKFVIYFYQYLYSKQTWRSLGSKKPGSLLFNLLCILVEFSGLKIRLCPLLFF